MEKTEEEKTLEERRKKRRRIYWENNKVRICRQIMDEAGILAYMYSISRCVYSKIENVEGYIRKMIRISFVWGITIFDEGRNICSQNGFSRVHVDSPENSRKY